MEIGAHTKLTWPLFLGILGFAVIATLIKRYFAIQNDTYWYMGVAAVAIIIVSLLRKVKNR